MAMGATQSTARRGPASCSALLEQVLVFGGGGRCMATSTVAFGLQLPVQSQSTLYAQPWEAAAGVPEVVAVARACDSAGFAYIAVRDHVAIPAPLTAAMGATRSEEHTSELQSLMRISYAVFRLKKKNPKLTDLSYAKPPSKDHPQRDSAIVGVSSNPPRYNLTLLVLTYEIS